MNIPAGKYFSGKAKTLFISCLFIIIHVCTRAQPVFYIESSVSAGTGEYAPFWNTANKYGLIPINNNSFLFRTGFQKEADTLEKISSFYGADLVYSYAGSSDLWIQQGYAGLNFYFLRLKGGMMHETFGNQDKDLSMGNYLWSGNARPLPVVSLYTNDFITIPFTSGLAEINAGISHGWFPDAHQFVNDAFLHDKFMLFRIGEKKWPLSINLGIHHAAIWGGVSPEHGQLPSGFATFKRVLLGKIGGSGGPGTEDINVAGNHVASYSLGFDIKGHKNDIGLYWQTCLDDKNGRVGTDWKNREDGLWGIAIKNRSGNAFLQKVLLEFMNTTHQSGDTSKSGNDNYFNNGIYKSGWTNYKMTIGTPLITSPAYTSRTPEMFNYLDNNSLMAFNAGALLNINGNRLLFRLTYSLNYGTISIPFENRREQFYSLVGYDFRLNKFRNVNFSCNAGFDIGSHTGNNPGLLLTVRKTF